MHYLWHEGSERGERESSREGEEGCVRRELEGEEEAKVGERREGGGERREVEG